MAASFAFSADAKPFTPAIFSKEKINNEEQQSKIHLLQTELSAEKTKKCKTDEDLWRPVFPEERTIGGKIDQTNKRGQ
jgi:hypothetical protein